MPVDRFKSSLIMHQVPVS